MRVTVEAERRGERAVAVVGGGRWAKVFVSVLSTLGLPFRLVVVSSNNAEEFIGLHDVNGSEILVVSTVEELLLRHKVVAAIVVNAARQHFLTASRLIEAGVSILLEKPMALKQSEVTLLFQRAAKNGVLLMPALSFLYCSYLNRYALAVSNGGGAFGTTHLEWSDPQDEVRYGENKSYDNGISVVQDVMPHIWSILAITLHSRELSLDVTFCSIGRGGRKATFLLSAGAGRCLVSIERDARLRRRVVKTELSSGVRLTLDFTTEPGIISSGDERYCADPTWHHAETPICQQLRTFFSCLDKSKSDEEFGRVGDACIRLTETCDKLLKSAQMDWLRQCPRTHLNEDISYAVCDLLAGNFFDSQDIRSGHRVALKEHVCGLLQHLASIGSTGDWLSALQSHGLLQPKRFK